MVHEKTRFLITIDTEGDHLWSRPRVITTENARFLPRFQTLCEKYGLRPTWLVNYEMACAPEFVEFGRDVVARDAGEIGMHLHAWNSPPLLPLTADDYACQPYLIEYPLPVVRQKVSYLTNLLGDTFAVPITSHRAGRWAWNASYAEVLAENGYRVDCSVTPHVTWKPMKGAPEGNGGCDYRDAPEDPYILAIPGQDPSGPRELLEIPMTIRRVARGRLGRYLGQFLTSSPVSLARRVGSKLLPEVEWLRPDGRNLASLLRLVKNAVAEGRPCLEFMLHSSEFMPGGSPRFPTKASIERLFQQLEELFSFVQSMVDPGTLSEFGTCWTQQHPGAKVATRGQ